MGDWSKNGRLRRDGVSIVSADPMEVPARYAARSLDGHHIVYCDECDAHFYTEDDARRAADANWPLNQ